MMKPFTLLALSSLWLPLTGCGGEEQSKETEKTTPVVERGEGSSDPGALDLSYEGEDGTAAPESGSATPTDD